MKQDVSSRISLSEALTLLKPVMSKSSFYGSADNPGPRYTHIHALDIREGRRITLDRRKFLRWLDRIVGPPATSRSVRAARLNGHRKNGNLSEPPSIAALCQALKEGAITE